jgi:hypothetical protein
MLSLKRLRTITSLWAAALLIVGVAQAATNPWFGTWKLRIDRADQAAETLIYSDAGNGAMRMTSVEDKSELVTRFDGKPSVDVGADCHPDWTLAIKAASPTSYTWLFSRSGKPVAQGFNALSHNAKTFTEVSWDVHNPAKATTVTYERQ